jgi:type I restriction-modification system DNA methylase subunit
LIVYTTGPEKIQRTRTGLRDFVAHKLKRDESYKDAALVAFVSPLPETTWRFSYIKMEYATVEQDSGKVDTEERLTPARRFSYIVGAGESCHTAQTRFLDLLQDTTTDPTLAALEDAFSVEAVTKEFFTKYAELFEDLHAALEKMAAKDKTLRDEFAAKGVNTVDFAKKLMGQIVFLYFLQKKGWLGVKRGQPWGSGPRDFLRRLANGDYGAYANFFNDLLEPLFYDTLATERGAEAWSKRFNCRIPFLNGGLFEPVGDYDWRKTDVILPNKLFTNRDFVEEGITGTGVLDVFDRYNFTVNEAEPLEKEVAIDPEMLGKVFENLIEDNRRKGLGAFYTPREIVHYMCQESLINYLDTALNADKQQVPRADLETLIYEGEQISHYEAVTTTYKIKMPKSIEKYAQEIDDALANIAVCDPAVGSGAFPVGMMTEIVRARLALNPYFDDSTKRTPYHFKRHAIQYCLYGVDIDAGAVEIAKLRLWLSLVVDEEDVEHINPLPNLDYKIVAGNSLLGFPFKSQRLGEIEKLKQKFFDETDHAKKAQWKVQIDQLLAASFAASKKTLGYEVDFDFQIFFSEVFERKGGFDVMIGNPPYGMVTDQVNKEIFRNQFKAVEGRFDTFVLFIERAMSLCRIRGTLSYIIPSPLLSNLYARAIRRLILDTCAIIEITNFGMDVFNDPTVHTCIIVLAKKPERDVHVKIRKQVSAVEELRDGYDYLIPQGQLGTNQHTTFDIFVDSNTDKLLEHLISQGVLLGDLCYIRQCIKTGDDEKYVQHATTAPGSQWKPSLRGKSIGRYLTKETDLFIKYGPWLARNWANKTFYEREKIAIRETGDRITATYDGDHRYFLSSLYAVYPKHPDEKYSLKYLLAILNSNLATYFLKKIALELTKGAFTKFRTNQLARLPIRRINFTDRSEQAIHKGLASLVDRILAAKQRNPEVDTSALEQEIDGLVYRLYDLTQAEIDIVEDSVRGR